MTYPTGGVSKAPQNRTSDRFSLINRRNIQVQHYTRTLIAEALRVRLLSMEIVDDLQMQIMGKLDDLMREYRKKWNRDLSEEATKHLLSSIFYTLDTYLLAFHDPMYAITAVQSTSVEEMFHGGRQQLRERVCETVFLSVQVKKQRISTVNRAYHRVMDEEIHAYLRAYDYQYAAQDRICPLSYPLMSDAGIEEQGIMYAYTYLRRMQTENKMLQLFEPEERDLLFTSYAALHGFTPEEMTVNLFSIVMNNALGASILGKYTGILTLTNEETDLLYQKLHRKTTRELESMAADAVQTMANDFHLTDNAMLAYSKAYGRRFAQKLIMARNEQKSATLFVASNPLHLFRQ